MEVLLYSLPYRAYFPEEFHVDIFVKCHVSVREAADSSGEIIVNQHELRIRVFPVSSHAVRAGMATFEKYIFGRLRLFVFFAVSWKKQEEIL